MFTAKQVANQLSISIRSVYRAIEKGDLEHHRFPQIRISKSQLEAFKQKAVVATPATTHLTAALITKHLDS
jgi:excisionase family DNA binding protein